MKILFVENQPQFSDLAVKTFLSEHQVSVVLSIAEAHGALAGQTFDLVLLDYDLDDGKGTELVTWIKRLPNSPPIIAVSSHTEGNEALIKAGADAVCSKMQFTRIQSEIAQLFSVPQKDE